MMSGAELAFASGRAKTSSLFMWGGEGGCARPPLVSIWLRMAPYFNGMRME